MFKQISNAICNFYFRVVLGKTIEKLDNPTTESKTFIKNLKKNNANHQNYEKQLNS